MDTFDKDEKELLGTDDEAGNLQGFLSSPVSYVLENDVELHKGETIGFGKDDKHIIICNEGTALLGMTLKISYQTTKEA